MPSRTNKLRKNPTSEGKRAVFESLKSPQNVESILLSDKLNNSQIFFQIKDECKKYDMMGTTNHTKNERYIKRLKYNK